MTRPVLVLVTGSRALANHDGARAWLRSELDARRPAVVVTGTLPQRDPRTGKWLPATWPDTWAVEWARENGVEAWVFCLDAMTYDAHGTETGEWTDRAPPGPRDPERFGWPLYRNTMAVAAAARAERYDVIVLALRCPQSRTHGTEQTMACARGACFAIVSETFTLTEP